MLDGSGTGHGAMNARTRDEVVAGYGSSVAVRDSTDTPRSSKASTATT